MAIERIVNSVAADDDSVDEVEFELKLRPHDFANYIGQERLKKNIQLAITAAKKRGEPLDHVLLYGPPGLGKTTMASVIANEMGAQIRITSGPAIERAGDLASLLTNLQAIRISDKKLQWSSKEHNNRGREKYATEEPISYEILHEFDACNLGNQVV